MTKFVYVVTGLELGWDCVCGVYSDYERALVSIFYDNEDGLTVDEMEEQYDAGDTGYIIHTKRMEE